MTKAIRNEVPASPGRREALGILAAAVAAGSARTAIAGSPGQLPASGRFGGALAAVRTYAEREIDAFGLPGLVITFVSLDAGVQTCALGLADREGQLPLTVDHLMQIGSISKSMTGLWYHRQADRGVLSLSDPIARYLPDVPLPKEPITLAQLLNHTSGLAHDAPVFPRVPGDRLWVGFEPGERMSYSNTGYTLLGLAMGRIGGRPHAEILDQEILVPIGMDGAVAHLRSVDRARFATGYSPARDDVPALSPVRLSPGPWTQEDMAAGSIGASAAMMAGYLRYVIGLARGKGGPLMSDKAARALFAGNVASSEFGPGARYASGFGMISIDGRRAIHHTGGMLTFSSSFHVDPEAGIGCFASVNAALEDYRPRQVTSYAIQAMRAQREGKALPAPPPVIADQRSTWVKLGGVYRSARGTSLTIEATDRQAWLIADGHRGRLRLVSSDLLATDHPLRPQHRLRLVGKGAGLGLWWGPEFYSRKARPPQESADARLAALAGTYVSRDPWGGQILIIPQGNALYADGLGVLVRRPAGYWSLDDDQGGVDRYWFEDHIGGRPFRLNLAGVDFFRVE